MSKKNKTLVLVLLLAVGPAGSSSVSDFERCRVWRIR